MPISAEVVGLSSVPVPDVIEARWTMDYAVGVEDYSRQLLDTTRDVLQVHPMYLGHSEWQAIGQVLEGTPLTATERARGVAYSFDQRIHRPLRVGMILETAATISKALPHRSGTWLEFAVETTNQGDLVTLTHHSIVLRDVYLTDHIATSETPSNRVPWLTETAHMEYITLSPGSAHLFSACGRSYNPIHTDIAAAKAAGLDKLILHGAATMARAVSALSKSLLYGNIERVTEISGSFRAMVDVPSVIELHAGAVTTEPDRGMVRFEVRNARGQSAIARGKLTFASP